MSTSSATKRRGNSAPFSSRKKAKIQHNSMDDLPWKAVSRPVEAGMDGDDGILELEEVEGIEVVYENTEGGRVVKFNVVSDDFPVQDANDVEELNNSGDTEPMITADVSQFDSVNLLPNWHAQSLHPQLFKALHSKGFLSPTPIQAAALPIALAGRDVVGVAQTGSGKTLAYGLPILHYLLSRPLTSSKKRRPVRALILAPTRELALQVSTHLNEYLNTSESTNAESPHTSVGEQVPKNDKQQKTANSTAKKPPHVSIGTIVGGMSAQKQRRILDRGVDVLVATPGRLWDIMEDDDKLARDIKNLRFLVLDEADRMIEAGHFEELDNILRLTLRSSDEDKIATDLDGLSQIDLANEEEETKEGIIKDGLQTFVFSATLSKDLQRNLKKRFKSKGSKKHYKKDQVPVSTLDDLLEKLDFRDPNPEVIDLSPVGGVVSTLKEGKIECLTADKDVYLYYFLLRYPGRSLVFLSSIDGIRRLMPLMELLNIKAFPLHSQLEQRQRLKNLDRFKSIPNAVLLSTDIAARGLDIPAVDHVVHFQIPRSADTYIHRNGRTARAMRKGFSILMCAPDERRVVKALLSNVGRDETDIPEISIELGLLDKLKARVQLARQIETSLHKVKKANHDKTWMKEAAEVLGVDLDSDFDSNDEEKPSNQKRKAKDMKIASLKAELKCMLAEPLVAKGVLTSYITSGSTPIVEGLLAGEFNNTMVGVKQTEAGNDLMVSKKKKKIEIVNDTKEEEWNGIETD